MITPKFKLDQDNDYLYIFINAPFAKLNEVDVFVDDNDFRFYCKPYYLRLNLPGKILDAQNDVSTYDFDQNLFKLKFPKQTPGEIFQDLDLLTKLLTQPKPASSGVLVEELDNDNDENDEEDSGDEWFIEQNIASSDADDKLSENLNVNGFKYGFALTKSDVLIKLGTEYSLLFDVTEPDSTSLPDRKKFRIENENSKFNDDHYLADLYDNDSIKNDIIPFQPYWYTSDGSELNYTDSEVDCLKNLPKRTYLLENEQKLNAYMGLIDILYAYCYNYRVNIGEKNSESGWTISKLSSTLSCFDTFKSIEDVIVASFRRSLCFPLYRNWQLCEVVLKDLIKILKLGKKQILKCFIDIRSIFHDGDNRYILNDLFITDYCIWIQYSKEKTLNALVDSIEKLKITKEMVGFDLECLEIAAKLAIEEEENGGCNDDETDGETKSDNYDKSDKSDDEKLAENLNDLLKLNSTQTQKQKPKIEELN